MTGHFESGKGRRRKQIGQWYDQMRKKHAAANWKQRPAKTAVDPCSGSRRRQGVQRRERPGSRIRLHMVMAGGDAEVFHSERD